jgi:flagellin-specific chaperone FliS
MYQAAYRHQEYRQQDVMGASPVHLVVMAYDLAIRACEQRDFEKAVKTIGVLRDALNFDYPEVSNGLFRLYQWCMECIRVGDYPSALATLRDLRSAWHTAEQRLSNRGASVPAPNYAGVSQAAA